MTEANKIKVKKEIYEWAIKESQKDIEEIKIKFRNIEKWINQDEFPTFRQIEKLANFLKVPLGYMFLDKPPKSNIIESEYRTIGNKKPYISKNLKDTIYDMSRKQDWISEYRKDNGWDRIIVDNYNELDVDDILGIVKKAKEFLNLEEFWYKDCKDNRIAYNFLREKLELKGIIVMQNGIVGSNTHRKLDIDEFRGFMLYDEYAPLIFINANDSITGKIFTLVHEFIHILFKEDDILENIDLFRDMKLESQINKITVEFLMPESHIKKYWNKQEKTLNQIEELSKLFNVSRLALAIRLNSLKLINQSLVREVNEVTKKDLKKKKDKSNGGDYWVTYKSRYSNNFIETVIQGAESGEISYNYAFKLLDVRAKNYDVLKEGIIRYG